MMTIYFFKTPQQSVIATQADHLLTQDEVQKLCWLYGGATLLEGQSLTGRFIGPRREMVTPWSTNAVEITQNMGMKGILRIEEYFPILPFDNLPSDNLAAPQDPSSNSKSSNSQMFDPMLQRKYDGLDQDSFTVHIELGAGVASDTMWTSDITYDYVKINADYHT